MNWFKKFIGWIKGIATRPGLDKFLSRWLELAVAEAGKLAEVNNNLEFHEWKDELFERVKGLTGEVKGTWIAILIHIAYENLKAKK